MVETLGRTSVPNPKLSTPPGAAHPYLKKVECPLPEAYIVWKFKNGFRILIDQAVLESLIKTTFARFDQEDIRTGSPELKGTFPYYLPMWVPPGRVNSFHDELMSGDHFQLICKIKTHMIFIENRKSQYRSSIPFQAFFQLRRPHFYFLENFVLSSPIFVDFGYISARETQIVAKILSKDPSFKPKNQFRQPHFWKPGRHIGLPTHFFSKHPPGCLKP